MIARVIAGKPRVAAEPQPARAVLEDPVNLAAGQAVRRAHGQEANGFRRACVADDLLQTAAFRCRPEPPLGIDLERIDRVRGEAGRVLRVVPVDALHATVAIHEVKPAGERADPEIAGLVLHDGRDHGRTERAGLVLAEGQLLDRSGVRVDDVDATAIGADPQAAVTGLVDGHDAGGAGRARVAGAHRDGAQAARGRQDLEAGVHRADPQRAMAVEMQRHDVPVAERIGPARHLVDGRPDAGFLVQAGKAVAERADPQLAPLVVGEGRDATACQPLGTLRTEFPAVAVPATDAAGTGSDPQQPAGALGQRQDVRIAQRRRIPRIVPVVRKATRAPVEQVESVGRAYPDLAAAVLEQGVHGVAGQRSGIVGGVPVDVFDIAARVDPGETAAIGADPDAARPVLEQLHDAAALARVEAAVVGEGALVRVEAVKPGVGSDPQRVRGVTEQRVDMIAGERLPVRVVVTEVGNVLGHRIDHVDAAVAAAYPEAPARVERDAVDDVAGQRVAALRVVTQHRERIGGAPPVGEAGAADRQPQVMVGVLDDLLDEVAGQAVAVARRVRVTVDLPAVVAHEAVFGADPDVALRVLERGVDGALRQAVGGRQVLERNRADGRAGFGGTGVTAKRGPGEEQRRKAAGERRPGLRTAAHPPG